MYKSHIDHHVIGCVQILLERTEMRMLIWMMGINRIENARSEEIRARTGVSNISKNIREARVRWL